MEGSACSVGGYGPGGGVGVDYFVDYYPGYGIADCVGGLGALYCYSFGFVREAAGPGAYDVEAGG